MKHPEGKKVLVLFDFDGTLTVKNSLAEFIRQTHGVASMAAGFIVLSPWLFLYPLGLIPNWKAKEKVLKWYYGGWKEEAFAGQCRRFCREVVPGILRKEALAKLRLHQSLGHRVIIVTSSPEDWVKPWAEGEHIECIGTRLEKANGLLTGKISGKNCYGPEKAARVREIIAAGEYNYIYAYGDSRGDKEMLEMADEVFYKRF